MGKAALTTGAYQTKSIIAGAQRCINLYMEQNPEGVVFPFTHYPTPGLTTVASSGQTSWRGLYYASNNQLYGVCGNTFYSISTDWILSPIGTLASSTGTVSMVDNQVDLLIVDGTSAGYDYNITTNTFTTINQPGFYGSNQVNYVDGYFVCNYPGTREWYISLINTAEFDPLYYASKSGSPDNLVGIGISRRYIYLLGEFTSEVWFNAGNTSFPFQILPGSFIQYGCAATNSIAQMDGEVYWLAQSPQGQAYVCRSQNFGAVQISTFAMDQEFQTYGKLSDAIGYTYEVNGHFFYVLTFPQANKTWVFDLSNNQWNEWLWTDNDGNFNRHRSNCFAFANGNLVVGDWQNGNLYVLDQNNYSDFGGPIVRVRSFYHTEDDDSNRLRYKQFIAEMESGNAPATVYLSWSDDRGKTYGNPVSQTMGTTGQYLTSISWWRLGMARDRVFQLQWSDPVKTALNGAFVDVAQNHK